MADHHDRKGGISLKTICHIQLGLIAILLALHLFELYQTLTPPLPLSAQFKALKTTQTSLYNEVQKVKTEANTK